MKVGVEENSQPEVPVVWVTCRRANPAEILGAVLDSLRSRADLRAPSILFLLRDTAVRERPRKSVWTTDDLIALYRNPRELGRRERWEMELIRSLPPVSMSEFAVAPPEEVFRRVGVALDYRQEKAKGILTLGPAELVGDQPSLQRCSYRLPEGHSWQRDVELTKQLAPAGAGCAYDATSRLLVLIGEPASLTAFEGVLRALGGRPADWDLFHSKP